MLVCGRASARMGKPLHIFNPATNKNEDFTALHPDFDQDAHKQVMNAHVHNVAAVKVHLGRARDDFKYYRNSLAQLRNEARNKALKRVPARDKAKDSARMERRNRR